MKASTILITGGAGYIGSHVCVELIELGCVVVVVDNLSNSSLESLKRVKSITNKDVFFHKIDIRDKQELRSVFESYSIDAVIHLAGLKSVGESVEKPIEYYDVNILGLLSLVQVMKEFDCKNLVFSSSATVYGESCQSPISEKCTLSATNPYGRSKIISEEFLKDVFIADPKWNIVILRYFNPVGAHRSGMIGENPNGTPNNLMPYISQVAVGKLEILKVFGGDYNTYDGTGIRDYIHVVDLAKGHVRAINSSREAQVLTVNLGTGVGYSVLDVVNAFERVSGEKIPFQITNRRAGDIAICYADPSYALDILGWSAECGLDDMCRDAWRWQRKNPDGYPNMAI